MILEKLIGTIAPHQCIRCGSEGSVVCAWCLSDIRVPVPPRCYRCKTLTRDFRVFSKCKRSSALRHVWVATVYDGLAKNVIRTFKFDRAQSTAGIIAAQMTDILPQLHSETVIVPVSSATSRIRQRQDR